MAAISKRKSIVLETRRIRLREIQDGDMPILFQWRNAEKFRLLLHYNTDKISYEEFCEEFARDSKCYKYRLLIEKKESTLPVGFTYIDTFSKKYGSCFINLFIAEPFEKKGYGLDAFVLFVLFLFQYESLKRLFVHAFESNKHSIDCIRSIGMRELVGNVTKTFRSGKEQNIVCFAADQNIVPKLLSISEYLSRPQQNSLLKPVNQECE